MLHFIQELLKKSRPRKTTATNQMEELLIEVTKGILPTSAIYKGLFPLTVYLMAKDSTDDGQNLNQILKPLIVGSDFRPTIIGFSSKDRAAQYARAMGCEMPLLQRTTFREAIGALLPSGKNWLFMNPGLTGAKNFSPPEIFEMLSLENNPRRVARLGEIQIPELKITPLLELPQELVKALRTYGLSQSKIDEIYLGLIQWNEPHPHLLIGVRFAYHPELEQNEICTDLLRIVSDVSGVTVDVLVVGQTLSAAQAENEMQAVLADSASIPK